MHWFAVYVAIGWIIRAGMIPTVLRRNFAPGASMAWLGIVFLHPYIGLSLYITFGESRLGPGRVRHHQQLLKHYALADPQTDQSAELAADYRSLVHLATRVGQMPVAGGNTVEFFTDSPTMVSRLVADIESATSQVHLLYYILSPDATGQRILTALKSAAAKGVKCRVIVDQFASRSDFRKSGFAAQLTSAGVEVIAALPSSLLRRRDLRNHRKLSVIDNRLAYTGSQNLINPDYGGKRGGPWVDLSGRITGPIVAEFAAVFASDWAFETNQQLPAPPINSIPQISGGAPMQIVPTGPVSPAESFRRLFLGIADSAQHQLVLTTPYFVPDEATLLALQTAADRGVQVVLILPETSDNIFTAAAGRAHYSTLLDAGIAIHLYQPGLIHAKLITVDNTLAVFGSANLDVRSFHLNFELTTLVYSEDAASRLHAIQQTYITNSRQLKSDEWARRSAIAKYADAAVALISPLL
jgi:cardiolipin synthase